MLEKPDSKSEDGTVQTLHELVLSLEKQGLVDLTISGHKVDRPAAVKKGISEDTLDVQHQSYSCYRPNAVALKNAKYQNFAGVVGVKNLSSSPQLELVWRSWAARRCVCVCVTVKTRLCLENTS